MFCDKRISVVVFAMAIDKQKLFTTISELVAEELKVEVHIL